MLNKVTSHLPHKEEVRFSDRKQRIYDFLIANPIGVLSSVTPDGNPHGTVIYYHAARDFTITFLTKTQTRKYDNLRRNNHVMLTVFDAQTQTTAQVAGKTVEISDSYEINVVAGAILGASLQTSEAGMLPITKLEAGRYVAFKLTPVQIRMAVYARPDPGDYSELFESIESFELNEKDV